MILTSSQVKQYLYNAGFKGIALNYAVAICNCESGFNTNAHNTRGEDSRGLMQINLDAHPQYSNYNLFDPQVNCTLAYDIYNRSSKTFKAWTCAKLLNLQNPTIFYVGAGLVLLASALYVSNAQD